eukprot:11188124-Lingulodinium_polyedra.AAC.1
MSVLTSRSVTNASATEVAQPGSPHRRLTSPSQPWPSRSQAFSWSARVIAGICAMKWAAGSADCSNSEQR